MGSDRRDKFINKYFSSHQIYWNSAYTTYVIFCHCRENFPFDVVRGGKWGLWSKRCKHLFARRRTSGRLAKLECQGLVRFSAVRFTLPSSTCACSEHREGQGRHFWAHHSPGTPSKGPSQVNKLVWESFRLHPSSTKAMGGNQTFVLGVSMFDKHCLCPLMSRW